MYYRLRQDNARILNTGFSLAVTFVDTTGVEYDARCFFSDIGVAINSETGMPIPGRRIAITTNLVNLDGMVVFTEEKHPTEDWKIRFTYNGVPFYGEVLDAMFDRTFGSITMNAGKIKVSA